MRSSWRCSINSTIRIAELSADGAYDSHGCYQAIEARGAKAAIPPWEDAVWPVTDQTPYAAQRNAALETIEAKGARLGNISSVTIVAVSPRPPCTV